MDRLIKLQMSAGAKLERAFSNYMKDGKERKTKSYYEKRLKSVEEDWSEFKTRDEEIICLKTEADEEKPYLRDDYYATVEELYFRMYARLEDDFNELFPPETPSALDISRRQITCEEESKLYSGIKLQKLSIPTFNGDYQNWITFYDLFKGLVHENKNIPPAQKLQYLKLYVSGDAYNLLSKITISNANYLPAWKLLKERYHNTRVLVRTQLDLLFDQPTIRSESAQGVKRILDTVNECITSLRNLEIPIVDWDPIFVYIAVKKLPVETHQLWEQSLDRSSALSTWTELEEFLMKRFRALEALDTKKTNIKDEKGNTKSTKTFMRSQSFLIEGTKTTCGICNGNHSLRNCSDFQKLDFHNKNEIVRKKGLCINCLGVGHRAPQCPSKNSCFRCHKRHHTLLHIFPSDQPSGSNILKTTNFKTSTPAPQNQSVNEHKEFPINSMHTFTQREILLATALVTLQGPGKIKRTFRALLDQGSQASFCTEYVVQSLGLRRSPVIASISGLGQTQVGTSRARVYADIVIPSTTDTVKLEALVLKDLAHYLPAKTITSTNWAHIQGLNLADPRFAQPGRIDVILGADVHGELILSDVRKGSKGQPVAQRTLLGWVLSGAMAETELQPQQYQTFTSSVSLNLISQQLQEFWSIEEPPSIQCPKSEDTECERFYEHTHTRLQGGRYCVKLPFISEDHQHSLGSSRAAAVASFLSLERRFSSNPSIKEQYSKCIEEYLQLGHMRLAKTKEEDNLIIYKGKQCYQSYYLPHHAVFKESVSTRLRVVFDASRKTSSSVSLNDILHTGPSLQNEMVAVLMRWRKFKFALMADIEKMYRQIAVHPDDINYQRIVWRSDVSEPIQDYCLSTVTFGVTCAPHLAIRTLQQLAKDEQTTFPSASQVLLKDFYVDDVLTGADSISETIELQCDLDQLLQRGGFKLKKWLSNKAVILANIPEDDRAVQISVDLTLENGVKSLGILWYPSMDTLGCRIKLTPDKVVKSKRELLSEIAKLYDPMGWIAPVIIYAKILMQTLWIHGCDWDEPVPKEVQSKWLEFKKQAADLEQIRIPRWYGIFKSSNQIEIHAFSDASQHAYAAVVYLRVITSDGNVRVNIIMAKTKVAPIKPVTIPRLELCGAVLAAKVVRHILTIMQFSAIEIHMWTDSSIVLSWLRGHPRKWATFVANRCSEILSLLGNVPWHHVPTASNPADLASRGVLPTELNDHTLWWNGPSWLSRDRSFWPRLIDIPSTNLEERRLICATSLSDTKNLFKTDLLHKFSSFTKLVRVTAYCLRFCVRRKDCAYTWLTSEELEKATKLWLRFEQSLHFSVEFEHIKSRKQLPGKSKLQNLNPVLDNDGLLRLGGRLRNADISYDKQHPIIIPQSGHLTTLLIRHYHLLTLHGGTQLTLSTLRQKYWVLNGRNVVRKVIHTCMRCHRFKAQTNTQFMGDLPSPRINITRPFTHTGIDYCGPFNIKTSKRRGAPSSKGYIALFVCLAVKAIHLELVSDMTTQAFLAAFNRFVARRGLCKYIYSDCGTNFIGANAYLKDIAIKQMEVAEKTSNQGVQWHFNPPHAPHFGGLWEAGVKSTKYHLRRVLGNSTLTFEETTTVLAQIEACLNSRPLCPLTADPDDTSALTPGHFLIGDSLLAPPQEDYSMTNPHRLNRWQLTQSLSQQFWKKWSSEYLTRLQQRPKWNIQQPNLKKGDLVLVKDDRLSPMNWPLGRIVEIFPGKDELVRVVDVRTKHATIRRPITKISRLPIDNPISLENSYNETIK